MIKPRLLTAAFACLALAACHKPVEQVTTDDMVMGNANAPVTVVEYASVACPVCGKFAVDSFPAFKTKYIDSGQVKYVFREILAHDPRMAAAGFLTARCAGKDKYFSVLDDIFRNQDAIEADINNGLEKVAERAGLSRKDYEACVADPKAIEALNTRTDKNGKDHDITGTPTFEIGDQRIESLPAPGQLEAAVAAAKAKKS